MGITYLLDQKLSPSVQCDTKIWQLHLEITALPEHHAEAVQVCILPIMLYGSECWALARVDARKVDTLDQWCLRRILDIRWYHCVSNCEVWRLTEKLPLTSIIQKRRLTMFGHLVRMDESTDARRILTAVPQSEWRRPVGRPYTSWMATLNNDLAQHNLTVEDAIELALNKPLWRLLAASRATHWWCMPNDDDDDVQS